MPGDLLEHGGGSGGLTGSLISATACGVHLFKSGSLDPSGCFLCKVSSFSSSITETDVVVVAADAAVVVSDGS